MAFTKTSVLVNANEPVRARCKSYEDDGPLGHIAAVTLGSDDSQFHIQANDVEILLAVLDDMRTKVAQAHQTWLAEQEQP